MPLEFWGDKKGLMATRKVWGDKRRLGGRAVKSEDVLTDQLWSDMEAAGLTLKVEKHTQRVPRSERGGEVIEPLVSTQATFEGY